MTRICTLISALIFLAFASPSHAITFHFSFAGGAVQGIVSGLEDTIAFQSADSIVVTDSIIGGLGEYAPGQFNEFQVLVSGTVMQRAQFISFVINGFFLSFFFDNGSGNGSLTLVAPGVQPITGILVFSAVPEVPLPGALPLFATGLGALGLIAWRRRRMAVAT
jgi:hypothetical protein